MESFQGPILLGEHFNVECLQQEFRFEEEEEDEDEGGIVAPPFSTSLLQDKMPFLQMLQSVETPPNFQTLLRLQHLKKQQPWEEEIQILNPYEIMETQNQIQALELESCVTQDLIHSPIKSETKDLPLNNKPSPVVTRERRKRKRTKPIKNKEQVESQRMTHIAVERNRRRQMNDHLNTLRSLMPPSYVQRGDQASIIGGAIDFVKELEQLLESLEAQKRMRLGITTTTTVQGGVSSSTNTDRAILSNRFTVSSPQVENYDNKRNSDGVEIEVIVIQNHVNLKIQCPRRSGQLLKAIVGLEDLRLTFLHLNITSSSQATIHYSFNLKIEEDCKLGSADEIAAAVHQLFGYINAS